MDHSRLTTGPPMSTLCAGAGMTSITPPSSPRRLWGGHFGAAEMIGQKMSGIGWPLPKPPLFLSTARLDSISARQAAANRHRCECGPTASDLHRAFRATRLALIAWGKVPTPHPPQRALRLRNRKHRGVYGLRPRVQFSASADGVQKASVVEPTRMSPSIP